MGLAPEIERKCPYCGRSVIDRPSLKQVLHEWPVCEGFNKAAQLAGEHTVSPEVVYKPDKGEPCD